MTTRQELEALLNQITDEKPMPQEYSARIEGKDVKVSSLRYGPHIYGKRHPLITASVNGENVHMGFAMRKGDALGHLLKLVSEKHIAADKVRAEKFAQQERERQKQAEERAAFLRPLQLRAAELLDYSMITLRKELGDKYGTAELGRALWQAANKLY